MDYNFQKYRVRDPIHGFIGFSEIERKVIDTKIFQRLRRIKQLALANYVYPGAMHTRFDHSLGVLHVAGRMAENLFKKGVFKTEEDIQIVRLAALLHDLGHGPFSHISEYLLEKNSDSLEVKSSNIEEIHEDITLKLILENSELRGILCKDLIDRIVSILSENSIGRDIVSGPLDADKFDYLKRDAYFTGVKYGEFDLDKILESLTYVSSDRYYLCIDKEGIYAIEQYILAKHHMNVQVYRHKVRSITDQMIIRGIKSAINTNDIVLTKLYKYDRSIDFIMNWITWDDQKLFQYLLESRNDKTKEIYCRLNNRKLFKLIHRKPILEIENVFLRINLLKLDDTFLCKKEKEISEIDAIKCQEDYIIINVVHIKNPLYRLPTRIISEEDILVVGKDKTPRYLKEIPESIMKLSGTEDKHQYLEVYAPLDNLENDPRKDQIKAEIDKEVSKILYQ